MKAQDLRIGILVNSVKWGVPATLDASDFAELHFRCDGAVLDETIISEYIEPIPLTEEWLDKLGFEKCYDKELPYQNAYRNGDLLLSQDFTMSYCAEYMETFGEPLTHVHQLQNLYHALTNEELTIKD